MNEFTQEEKKQLKHLWTSTAVKILNSSHDVMFYNVDSVLEAVNHLSAVIKILDNQKSMEVK